MSSQYEEIDPNDYAASTAHYLPDGTVDLNVLMPVEGGREIAAALEREAAAIAEAQRRAGQPAGTRTDLTAEQWQLAYDVIEAAEQTDGFIDDRAAGGTRAEITELLAALRPIVAERARDAAGGAA